MKHPNRAPVEALLTDVRLHLHDAASRGWLCVVREGCQAEPRAASLAAALAPEVAAQGWVVRLLPGLDWRSSETVLDTLATALEAVAPATPEAGRQTDAARPAPATIRHTRRMGQALTRLSGAHPHPLFILTVPTEALRPEMRPTLAMLRALVAGSGCCWLVIAPEALLERRAGPFGESPFASLFKAYGGDDAAPAREPQPEAATSLSLSRSLLPSM